MKTKRFFSALLAACLSLSLLLPVSAAGSGVSLAGASQAVTALGIMAGDGSGNLNLSAKVSRAEFVVMAVKASPAGDGVGQAATSPYPDVPRSHWASGYVEAAVSMGLAGAFSDGTFRPDREITLAEGASMALALLGYGAGDFSGAYPTGQMAMFRNLKLDKGVSALAPDAALTRQDAVYLFYNLLSARTKEGQPYINSLGYSLNAAGQVDLLSLVNGEMEGPVVAQGDWKAQLPFAPAQGKVYRDGALSAPGAIQDYDVVYWNRDMNTLWVSSKKATGVIQALEPAGSAPASVTMGGKTYPIETSQAAYALSDLGQYGLGSSVTLLLGRTGGVAAVADVSASVDGQIGVITAVSNGTFPDGQGGTYTAQNVTLLGVDGQTRQYQHRAGGMSVGAVVRVTAREGEMALRSLSSARLTGKVSADGTKAGKYPFAPGATILDVAEGKGAVFFPERLAGVELKGEMVRYYSLNSQGEIDRMILNNVTGDMYQYGILTDRKEEGQGMNKFVTYQYDIGGNSYTIPSSTTRWPVGAGPIQLLGDPANPEKLYSLNCAGTGEILGNQFAAGGRKYTLSEQVAVYEHRNGRYYLSSAARVAEGDYTLTAWYDRLDPEGGRVRVIVAKES